MLQLVIEILTMAVCCQSVVIPSFPAKKQSSVRIPLMSLMERWPIKNGLESVVCPGGAECPQFATCCQMTGGQWGCCPFPEAVCCSDGVHCCPKNSQCDLAQQRCTSGAGDEVDSVAMASKSPSWPSSGRSVGIITCPDRESECPDTTTCCQMASGSWGCCPFENAVCCSDKLHCCPKDTVCNLQEERCQKSLPTERDLPSLAAAEAPRLKLEPYYTNSTKNVCPDQHPCADQTTCCKLKSGKFGCCPFPNADCCTDGLHCCPQGFKCDLTAGKCAK